jgi:hypothetical protein
VQQTPPQQQQQQQQRIHFPFPQPPLLLSTQLETAEFLTDLPMQAPSALTNRKHRTPSASNQSNHAQQIHAPR